MDSRDKSKPLCKGCGATVARPTICDTCGIASHPGCISRTGHPFSDGRFLCCATTSSDPSDFLVLRVRDIIREEFASFREEIVRMFRTDLDGISAEMQDLSCRVANLEDKISSAAPSMNCEELMEEMLERERRSMNLIFYNLEELNSPSSPAGVASRDLSMAEEIIRKIQPLDPPRISVRRLGAFRQDHTRPLRVSLPSKSDVINVLKKKYVYSGPIGIKQDLTKRQRDHFLGVKKRLENLKDSGVTDMTIKYFNGVPKIVKVNQNARSKNGPPAL